MLFQPKNVRKFNCYSYAVDYRKEWLTSGFNRNYKGYDFLLNGGNIDKLTEIFVKENILIKFPKLIVIEKKDIKKGTRLIAFRMSDRDFHFMKRFPNGHWFHKMGRSNIEPIRKEIVFADTWFNKYYSKIIFLAYKEDY